MTERLRYLGFAEEVTYNPDTPPAVVQHVDIASATLDTPPDTELVYAGGLGRAPRTRRPGYYAPGGNIVYAFDIKTIGWLLKWALGNYVYTGGTTPATAEILQLYLGGATGGDFVLGDGEEVTDPIAYNANAATIDTAIETLYGAEKVAVATNTDFDLTFVVAVKKSGLVAHFGGLTGATDPTLTITTPYVSAKNLHEIYGDHDAILPSFRAWLGKDNLDDTAFEHIFAGCTISQLVIEVSDGFAMATADIIATKDSKGDIQTIAELLATLPDKYPLTFANLAVSVGAGNGNDKSTLIKSATLTINNNADAATGRSIGSRHPRRVIAGARDISFNLNFYYENIDELARLWGGASAPAAGGATGFPLSLVFDAGDDGELKIEISKAWYTAVPIQPSGKDEIVPAAAGKALVDTVLLNDDATNVDTEILVSLENDQAEMLAVAG